MKTSFCLIPLIAILTCVNSNTMEQKITLHLATIADTDKIVKVIDEHAAKEHTKMVILPKLFRKINITANAYSKQLYFAQNELGDVVAFKKLYIIPDKNTFNAIAQDEIRCCGPKSYLVNAHSINGNNEKKTVTKEQILPFNFKNNLTIYLGSDYTVPTYRQQGLNSKITE